MAIVPNLSGNTPTDKPFDHYNRRYDGDPIGDLVPEYAGERVLDTTNGVLYQAMGTTNATWVPVDAGGGTGDSTPSLRFNATTVEEGHAAGTITIGTLSISGTYTGTPVYALPNTHGNRVAVNSSTGAVTTGATLIDYEDITTLTFTAGVSGTTPDPADKTFNLAVLNVVEDVNPDAFNLGGPVVDAIPLSSHFTNTITIAGMDGAGTMVLSGMAANYRINGGALAGYSVPVLVYSGQTVQCEVLGDAAYSTGHTLTMTIGTTSDTFTITTMADPEVGDPLPTPTFFLKAISDTGDSNSDKLTNDTTPDFETDYIPVEDDELTIWKDAVAIDVHIVSAAEETLGNVSLGLGASPLTDGTFAFQLSVERPSTGQASSLSAAEYVTVDATAPTLSAGSSASIADTTATVGATTNEANGKMYIALTTSSTPPANSAIIVGTGFVFAANQTITTTGAKTFSVTDMTAATGYYGHIIQVDAAGNISSTTSVSFTTTGAVAFDPAVHGYHYWNFEAPYNDNGTTLNSTVGEWTTVQQVNDLCSAGNHFRQTVADNKPRYLLAGSYGAGNNGSLMDVGDGGAGHGSFMATINNMAIAAPFFIGIVWRQFYGGIPAFSLMLADSDILQFARHGGFADKVAIYSATNATEIRAGTGGLTDAALYHFYAEVNGAASTAKLGGATGSAETTGNLGVADFNNSAPLTIGSVTIGNTLNSIMIRVYIGPLSTKADWNAYAVSTWGVTI